MRRPARLRRTLRRRTNRIPARETSLERKMRANNSAAKDRLFAVFENQRLEGPQVRRAFQVLVRGHFERSAWRILSKFLRREQMPKTPRNLAIVRMSARACIVGLLLNSFAIAGGSSVRATRTENARSTLIVPAPSPSPTPRSSGISPTRDNMAAQADQGRRYGMSGFVGEPINLNVVNADIRDILNYITEQYGINFVIDSSVSAVPVTVNVQDVPWNAALDMILRANKLGVEVNGNILRIATSDSLAKEADTQRIIRDSRLDTSALVTEFIRLNYARASGTLATAAGSTAAFAGGSTNLSFSGGSGGDSGGSGEQGLLPIIKRRLSRLGSIEVDQRSNTLIITDVKENIEAIRQLVAILDQPEPQVEIETRIVIAQRNFSRDLGAQLSAGVLSLGRGGLGNISTLPAGSGAGSGAGKSGPNPFGVFGG